MGLDAAPEPPAAERSLAALSDGARKRNEYAVGARTADAERRMLQWDSLIALRLPESQCLAYDRFTGSCLVTIGEFNSNVNPLNPKTWPRSESLPSHRELLDIRKNVLEGLWDGIFTQSMLKESSDPAEQQAAEAAWRAHIRESAQGFDSNALRRIWQKHYPSLFAAQTEIEVQLMGASDSAFLISAAEKPDSARVVARSPEGFGDTLAATRERIYAWQTFPWEDLPECLRTWKPEEPGAQSPPIRAPFGWFILRASRFVRIPAKDFDQALPEILAIAALPEDPREYQDAVKPAADDGEEVDLRLWLLPHWRLRGRTGSLPSWGDTAHLAPIRVSSAHLPPDVRREIKARLSKTPSGILKNGFGIWYFESETGRKTVRRVSVPKEGSRARTLDPGLGIELALSAAVRSERDFKTDFLHARIVAISDSATAVAMVSDPFTLARKKWQARTVIVEERLLAP